MRRKRGVSEKRETMYVLVESRQEHEGIWYMEQTQGQPRMRHRASSTTRKKKLMSPTHSVSRNCML